MPQRADYTHIKENVELNEYRIHKYVYNLGILNVPEIYDYNPETKQMKMYKIRNMSVADWYGDDISELPTKQIEEIRNIIKTLAKYNIEYPDITGYNFIECQNKMWIIDFEHAICKQRIDNEFVIDFINGLNQWNPDFK